MEVEIENKNKEKNNSQNDTDENQNQNEKDALNLSGNCKSIDLEEEKNKENLNLNLNLIHKNLNTYANTNENYNTNKEIEKEISLRMLFEENLTLKKENEILQEKIISKTYELTKINHEKYSLFFELKELLTSLELIDLKKLNNFYLSNIENEIENLNDFRKNISSFMGIKFNIMSAYAKISYQSISSLMSPSQNNLTINRNNDYKENPNDYINSKYIEVLMENVKNYENELDEFIEINYKKL